MDEFMKELILPEKRRMAGAFQKITVLILLSAVNVNVFAEKILAQDNEAAAEILDIIDDLWRGESSHAQLTMEVKTANYKRVLAMEAWSKGKDYSMIQILKPKKEKGTATLKSEKNIYTYLPKTDRTIRLTTGMMMGSWMGSHFTNDDLVKESRLRDDYIPEVSFRGERDSKNIIQLTLIPKEDAPVVWGKIVVDIELPDYIPLKEIYYDEDLEISRTMVFSNVKTIGRRKLPMLLKIVPADKPNEYTQLLYQFIEFDVDINDRFFSISELQRYK